MTKNTRDFNAAECMIWMFKNNPGKIDVYIYKDYPRYLISNVPINQLQFPIGWYYFEKDKIINRDYPSIIVNIFFNE